MEQVFKVNLTYSNTILMFIVLFFIFFPWVSFGLNGFDAQPWVIISNLLFIFISSNNKLKKIIFFGYLLLIPIFFVALFDFGKNSLRGFFSYIILFTTLHVFYIVFSKYIIYLRFFLPIFNIIWLIGGILQMVFGSTVLSFLVTVRTSLDRGVTSFAPEPTHYGFMLLFLSWLTLLINNKVSKTSYILIILNIFFILFVAKSSMVFFYCILFALYIILSYASLAQVFKITPIILLICSAFIIYVNSGADNRITRVVSSVFVNPMLIIEQDQSVNARLSGPVLSIYGAYQDFFVPHGFNFYGDSTEAINQSLGSFFWYGYEVDLIMSGTGSLLYELGWIGIVIILLSYFIMAGNSFLYRKALAPFILLWVFLLGAVPMSFTLIPSIIVAYYFTNSSSQCNNFKIT